MRSALSPEASNPLSVKAAFRSDTFIFLISAAVNEADDMIGEKRQLLKES